MTQASNCFLFLLIAGFVRVLKALEFQESDFKALEVLEFRFWSLKVLDFFIEQDRKMSAF